MKYIIDTENGTCTPYKGVSSSIGKQILTQFELNYGVKEYNGIVADIQKWYYGSLVKASWCATSLSYFAQKCGLKLKAENVKTLLDQCKILSDTGTGRLYKYGEIPDKIESGDILFWLWGGASGTMTTGSSKHVGVAAKDTTGSLIPCIGGNQSDSICEHNYERRNLYAVYRV